MPKSMKLLLRISSILVLVLTSCATNKVVKDYRTVPLEKTSLEVPYFSNPAIDYVYKANITVYGNELTGIFIAKKINDTTHRVVFTTEFGNKLLDFEISETDFKVNFILEELDRKILINTLISDFRLLLRNHYTISEQFENSENNVYMALDKNKMNYLFISKPTNRLSQIVHTSKRKEIINLFFSSENDIFAKKIVIQHQNIKLKIELNYFNQQVN
jgi:phosphoribosylformylglycinamidine (FGAM) synthase PurS component